MRLFDEVIEWGDKLVYTGTKDEGLPPGVLNALDSYLAESNSKLLVILPLKDERDTEGKKKARSALMMESFESTATGELAVGKLEVVGRHAASALYNSAEYRRIPMRFLWMPLAKLQDGLGGKAKAIATLAMLGLGMLVAALVFVPYPLRMEANGQLLPSQRVLLFAPYEGQIVSIPEGLKSGSPIVKDQLLLRMYEKDLADRILQETLAIQEAEATINQARSTRDESAGDTKEVITAKINLSLKGQYLERLKKRVNALNTPGEFAVKSPLTGIVLGSPANSDFREYLLNRQVKPSDALLRIGYTDLKNPKASDWEIELKIPQKNIGQVLQAYMNKAPSSELDVDILLTSMPTKTFKGKLRRSKIAFQAITNRDANNEPDPVVQAWVRISGEGIPADARVPSSQLLAGTEVHARIRCGNRAMGYSLFHGVWEWVYEKIVFFF